LAIASGLSDFWADEETGTIRRIAKKNFLFSEKTAYHKKNVLFLRLKLSFLALKLINPKI